MKRTVMYVCLIAFPLLGGAQVIAPAITQNYPAGVVSKIYEVTLNTLIPHSTQVKLADILLARDKWVMEAAQKDGNLQAIKNMIDSFQVLFNAQLDGADRVQYETYLHKGFIEGNARAAVAALKQRIAVDAVTEKNLYTLHRARQLAAIKGYVLLEAGKRLTDSVTQLMALTDSLYNAHVTVAKGERYFAACIEQLNYAKPLAANTIGCLHQRFVAQTLRHGNDYHQNFNMAMRYCVMDTVHFRALYVDSLEAVAQQKVKAELIDYRYRYNLLQQDVDSIAPLVYDKVKRNLWLETRYPFGPTRDSLQTELNTIAGLRINKKLVGAGYSALGTSRISWALRFRDVLKITPQQVDSLCAHEFRIDSMIYRLSSSMPQGVFPLNRYFQANISLHKILTTNQYDSLAYLESLKPAHQRAQQTYELAVEYKLATQADSVSVVREFFHYFSTCITLEIRYSEDPVKYERIYKVALLNQPDILKRLQALNDDFVSRKMAMLSGRPLEY